jgi:hypothetical protein
MLNCTYSQRLDGLHVVLEPHVFSWMLARHEPLYDVVGGFDITWLGEHIERRSTHKQRQHICVIQKVAFELQAPLRIFVMIVHKAIVSAAKGDAPVTLIGDDHEKNLLMLTCTVAKILVALQIFSSGCISETDLQTKGTDQERGAEGSLF